MRAVEELRYLILAAQREGNRLLAQGLRALGLTPSQAEVLRILSDHQPLTLSALGGLLVCDSGQSPSRLVDRLVGKGYIERAPSKQDRRSVELTLTAEGSAASAKVAEIEEDVYALIGEALGGTDPQPLTEFLWKVVGGTVAGEALAQRRASQQEQTNV